MKATETAVLQILLLKLIIQSVCSNDGTLIPSEDMSAIFMIKRLLLSINKRCPIIYF